VIALVFLRREGAVNPAFLKWLMMATVPIFCLMMVAPVRYPKYAKYRSILFPVIAGLNVMPFVLMNPLAFLSVFLIAAHMFFSPLVVNQRPESQQLKWSG